jgi:hypothetical protein
MLGGDLMESDAASLKAGAMRFDWPAQASPARAAVGARTHAAPQMARSPWYLPTAATWAAVAITVAVLITDSIGALVWPHAAGSDWARVVLAAPATAGCIRQLLVRRRRRDGELAFYACHGPASTSLVGLVRVARVRWAIEMVFSQLTKGWMRAVG